MVEDNFSEAFMFSTIYLRLQGKVPPLQEWKDGIGVRVTFYCSGRSDIGSWQGTPSPKIEIGLNMNAFDFNSG